MQLVIAALFLALVTAAQTLPSGPLAIRDFTLQFDPAGTFSLSRMILDRSEWLPRGVVPPILSRRIVRSAGPARGPLGAPARGAGHWPSFRGAEAAGFADNQNLPERWNPATGENILWRTAIPGLAHSSPIVWGETMFVTSAISSRKDATFKPGLYGDGDASEDRSEHRWMLYAVDTRTGKIRWERAEE